MRYVLLALLCLTTTAQACWDGHLIRADRVSLQGHEETWNLEDVRAYGRWIPRIQALLPAGATIEDDGIRVLCVADDGSIDLKATNPQALFDEVALRVKASAKVVHAARAMATRAWTVQVAAGADRELLEAYAEKLNSRPPVDTGFAEYGGFPANNPWAFVVPRGDGHAVVVGAWFDAPGARAALAAITDTHGLSGFVRPL